MSTIQERIETVLSEHEHHTKLTGYTIDDGVLYCDCGQWNDDSCAQHKNHRAHVAAMLAPLIREAQAEAWDKGHADGWQSRQDDWAAGFVPSGYTQDDTNPYRSNDA